MEFTDYQHLRVERLPQGVVQLTLHRPDTR